MTSSVQRARLQLWTNMKPLVPSVVPVAIVSIVVAVVCASLFAWAVAFPGEGGVIMGGLFFGSFVIQYGALFTLHWVGNRNLAIVIQNNLQGRHFVDQIIRLVDWMFPLGGRRRLLLLPDTAGYRVFARRFRALVQYHLPDQSVTCLIERGNRLAQAFTTGSASRPAIVVSEGFVAWSDREQDQANAILLHEVGHLAGGDLRRIAWLQSLQFTTTFFAAYVILLTLIVANIGEYNESCDIPVVAGISMMLLPVVLLVSWWLWKWLQASKFLMFRGDYLFAGVAAVAVLFPLQFMPWSNDSIGAALVSVLIAAFFVALSFYWVALEAVLSTTFVKQEARADQFAAARLSNCDVLQHVLQKRAIPQRSRRRWTQIVARAIGLHKSHEDNELRLRLLDNPTGLLVPDFQVFTLLVIGMFGLFDLIFKMNWPFNLIAVVVWCIACAEWFAQVGRWLCSHRLAESRVTKRELALGGTISLCLLNLPLYADVTRKTTALLMPYQTWLFMQVGLYEVAAGLATGLLVGVMFLWPIHRAAPEVSHTGVSPFSIVSRSIDSTIWLCRCLTLACVSILIAGTVYLALGCETLVPGKVISLFMASIVSIGLFVGIRDTMQLEKQLK